MTITIDGVELQEHSKIGSMGETWIVFSGRYWATPHKQARMFAAVPSYAMNEENAIVRSSMKAIKKELG
jgi:hypothetical protein